MKHFSINKSLRLLTLIGLLGCLGNLQAQDDLQEFINKNSNSQSRRASGDIVVVDLSTFSATTRTTTLNVANGNRYRFINGTLTRANSLDNPVMFVGQNTYVEIGAGANIDASNTASRRETILMDGGELFIAKGGKLLGHKYTSKDLGYDFSSNPFAAVLMTSDNDAFNMEGGSEVFNSVVCQAAKASVNYSGGTMTQDAHADNFRSAADINLLGGYPQSGFQITLTEKDNVIVAPSNRDWLCSLSIAAPKKVDNDILVKNCNPYFLKDEPSLWAERVHWQGDSKYQVYANYGDNTIRLSFDDLQPFIDSWPREKDPLHPDDWHCGCVISKEPWKIDPFPLTVPCNGIKVKKEVEFPEDDLQWMIDGRPQQYEETYDCEGQIDQGENDVKIRKGATVYIRWIHWRGCGCANKHIWVWGTVYIEWRVWFTYYWRFIHVMPGGKVIIKDLNGDCDETVFHMEGGEVDYISGDSKGGKYGWYCPGGTIYVRGGKISGGTAGGWTGKNGKVYHHDGTVHGGIHNYGLHYWYGGYCTGGGTYTIYNYKGGRFYYYGGYCSDNGKIWNEGDLYIDGGGSISCGDIYCVRGCHIYILKKLLFKLHFIIDEPNIILNEPIILGGDGYNLTQADCDNIEITLPSGYTWKFDPTAGGIIIYSTAGITGVSTDQPSVEDTFDATGRKVDDARRGVTIQRMSDGTVRKVNVK